jgi:hypothetical protein
MKMNEIECKRFLYLQAYYIQSKALQNQSNELLKELEKKLEGLKVPAESYTVVSEQKD